MSQGSGLTTLADQMKQVVKITNEVIFKWNIARSDAYLGEDFVRSILINNVNKYCPYIFHRDFQRIKKLIGIETDKQNYINKVTLQPTVSKYLYLENKDLVDELLEVFTLLPYTSLKPTLTKEAETILSNHKDTRFNPFDFSHLKKVQF